MKNKGVILSEYVRRMIGSVTPINVCEKATYNNMGATIIDTVLQSGLNYYGVVYPRVYNFLSTYSHFRTTSDFIILIHTVPLGTIIRWNNDIKIHRITCLTWFFYNHNVQTESDASLWLENESNVNELLTISGVGNKTIDYLKSLVGLRDSVAIDRHLLRFLTLAGIDYQDYREAQDIYLDAARVLNWDPFFLDKSVWQFMALRKN